MTFETRNRQRSIAISYDLINQIKGATKESISVSAFIRLAVMKELARFRK